MNLGCPKFCKGYLCVDLLPKDPGVIKGNVYEFLTVIEPESCLEIKAKNLLEHLPDPGAFFELCKGALTKDGVLTIITDNAEFIPFYLPLFNKFGFGAHASNVYLNRYNDKNPNDRHFAVYTKLHLLNFAELYKLKVVKCNRMLRYGLARIKITLTKF